jgi:hypothetical protein
VFLGIEKTKKAVIAKERGMIKTPRWYILKDCIGDPYPDVGGDRVYKNINFL